jgi:hypothetical protein
MRPLSTLIITVSSFTLAAIHSPRRDAPAFTESRSTVHAYRADLAGNTPVIPGPNGSMPDDHDFPFWFTRISHGVFLVFSVELPGPSSRIIRTAP